MWVHDSVIVDGLDLMTRRQFRIDLGRAGEGDPLLLRIITCTGRTRRPCLGLIAGVHGDEYDGIVALHEIGRETSPDDLDGTLLIIPVANPAALAAGQRRTPQDDRDLNRTFPGDPTGTMTERLADLLARHVLHQTDLVFSLHSGGATGSLAPRVEFLNVPGPIGQSSYEAAWASGFPNLVGLPKLPGLLLSAMADVGVPLIEGEVGGCATVRPENVTYYKDRVVAVARHVGIDRRHPTIQGRPGIRRVWQRVHLVAGANGVFLREVEMEQAVRQGDRLGRIIDIEGEVVGDVLAPAHGVIGGYREHASVRAGDSVCTFWTPLLSPDCRDPSQSEGGNPR